MCTCVCACVCVCVRVCPSVRVPFSDCVTHLDLPELESPLRRVEEGVLLPDLGPCRVPGAAAGQRRRRPVQRRRRRRHHPRLDLHVARHRQRCKGRNVQAVDRKCGFSA